MIAPILLKEYVMDLMEHVYACLDLEETTVEGIMIFSKVLGVLIFIKEASNTDTGNRHESQALIV